jgi:hypothetical protein
MLCALGLADPPPATSSIISYPHIIGMSLGYRAKLASCVDCGDAVLLAHDNHLALSSTTCRSWCKTSKDGFLWGSFHVSVQDLRSHGRVVVPRFGANHLEWRRCSTICGAYSFGAST